MTYNSARTEVREIVDNAQDTSDAASEERGLLLLICIEDFRNACKAWRAGSLDINLDRIDALQSEYTGAIKEVGRPPEEVAEFNSSAEKIRREFLSVT